jgi:hypothetical protein
LGLTAVLEKNYKKQVISTSLLYPEFSTYQNIGFCGQALVMEVDEEWISGKKFFIEN